MAARDKFTTGADTAHALPAGIISRRAETCNAQFTYSCRSARLRLYRIGSPGTLTLNIYDESGGLPNNLLGTATYDGDTLGTGISGTWAGFDFGAGNEFSITSGTVYWIVLETPSNGDASNQVLWRVDSNNGYATGSLRYYYPTTWALNASEDHLFELWDDSAWSVPSKAINPTPSDTASDVTLDQGTVTWEDGGGATSYNIYYGTSSGNLSLVSSTQAGTSFTVTGITDGSPYDYLVTRYWRIDSTNSSGTTTGDEWSFTTIRFGPPTQTYFYSTTGQYYYLLIQADGSYGDVPGVGVENTDYVFLAAGYLPNFINTTRKLVAVANSKVWYEDI